MANKSLVAAQKAFRRGQEARSNARRNGVVTTQPKKKKKKKREEEPVKSSPKPSKPSRYSAPKQSKAKPNVPSTNKQAQYKAFKASSASAPKPAKKYDALADAKQAYNKGKNTTYLGTKQKTTTTKIGKTKLKSVNALTRSEFNRMTEASRYGKTLGNKVLKGNKKLGQKDIREKVGSKTAESAYKGKFITGAMQGSGFADVIHGSVGTYNKQAKKAIKKTQSSKAYLGGYVVGQVGGFGLTQTSAAGKAIAQGVGKGTAKAVGKGLGKKFAKNRAGEMIAEAPMNALDAVKMATDENGKVDKKKLRNYMIANTALTGAAGGALEGAAMKRAASRTKKLTELIGKQQAGTITSEELKQLQKVRSAIRKSAQNTDNLSGEVSAKGLEDIRSRASDARIEKAKGKPKSDFEPQVQQVRDAKNNKIISSEQAKIDRAQADLDKIAKTEKEAKNLPDHETITNKLKDANDRLDELKAMRDDPNVSGAEKTIEDSITKVEKEIDDLKKQESTVWSADRSKQRKADLENTVEEAQKRIDEVSKKADDVTENTTAEAKSTVDPELRAEYDAAETRLNQARDRLDAANKAKAGALAHAKNSKNAHGRISPKTKAELDKAKEAAEQAQAEYDEAFEAHKAASEKNNIAKLADEYADEANIVARDEGKNLSEEEVKSLGLKNMKEDLANIDDQIALKTRQLAEATGDNAGAIRKELETLRQQRMVVSSAIENNPTRKALMQASDAIGDTIKKRTNTIRQKLNRAFIDSFGDWEAIARNIDDPELRSTLFDKIQKLRMSRSQTTSQVMDKFLKIYDDLGFVGKKAKQKREDFDRYTFLMHEVDRIEQGTGFTGKTADEVAEEIAELTEKYKNDFITIDGVKMNQLEYYQQSMVKYFDELLDRDVESGFCTAEYAQNLRETYKNYVPTFRDDDGLEAIGKRIPGEEIDPNRVRAATGGTDLDVLPLYKQAFEKTEATIVRQNTNDLVSFVAEIAQVNRKDLVQGYSPKEYLESATYAIKSPKDGSYRIAFYKDGERQTLKINEGMYKGIKQWSGEDRAFFMNCKLINKVSNKITRWFKDWITDYSLIFGARNFIRDLETGLFYSSHPLRYARNIPRAMSCVLGDTKFMQTLSKSDKLPQSFKNYLEEGQMLAQAYKKNGGQMSNLVSETDPERVLRRLQRKNGPLATIREINNTIEMIPRMAEFSSAVEEKAMKLGNISREDWYKMSPNARRRLMNSALDDSDTLARAMNRAKEVTLNFDRSGYVGRWLNSSFVPFFNPAIQGADKLTRVLARDNHTATEWTKMVVLFGVIGQGSEVLLNGIYSDNEKYKSLSDYEKTGFYHIPMSIFGGDEDSFLKIPRAREVAAVQGPLDWYLQHVKYQCAGKEENLFKSLKSNAQIWWEQIGPVSPISDNIFYTPYRIGKKGETWYGGYIETLDDQELVRAGESDKVWDENTTQVAKGINKLLLDGSDKLKFLGFSDAQIKSIRSKMWSPKKIDDLLDSYMGVIYDMGIKNTSMKNSSMLETIDEFKSGDVGKGTLGLANIFGSSFGTAFAVDSVMSNAYRSNQYAQKADLQSQLDKMTKGLEEGSDEYNKVIRSKEYMEVNAKMRRLNQSFAYTSATYDNLMSNIYLREDMTHAQKNYWAKQIKKQQNLLLYGRQQGDAIANADPMKWAYNATRKDGSRLFTDDQVVDLCSFTFQDGNNALKNVWKKVKDSGADRKEFFDVTLGSRNINRITGEPLSSVQYNVNAFVIADRQRKTGKTYDKIIQAFEPFDNDTLKNEMKRAQNYYSYGGGNLGTYAYSHRTVVQAGIDLNVSTYGKNGMETWDIINALSNGRSKTGKKYLDRAFYAEGVYVSQRMNAGRCLASNKYKDLGIDTLEVNTFCKDNGFSYKGDKSTYPKGEDVEAAIKKKYGDKPLEVQAAVYEEIMGPFKGNPFGKIGDYSLENDTGITDLDKGGWGHGRRGRRRRHYGGGGGGRGKHFNPQVAKISGNPEVTKVSSPSYRTSRSSVRTAKAKTTDFTFDSNLNDAYRKKLKKLRDDSRKDLSRG